MKHIQIYLIFTICLGIYSCDNKKTADVSDIKLNISIQRFDKEFDQVGADVAGQQTLRNKYEWFYDDYTGGMLGVGTIADPQFGANVSAVVGNTDYKELKAATARTFPSLETQEEEITHAFKTIRYYYPKQKFPRLISFISGFAVQTPVGNDYIGIGLDMFLGKSGEKFYPALRQSIPHYIARRFSPEYISLRVAEVFLREEMFPERDEDRTLISKMIYNGKILYMMDQLFPDKTDSLKIGYTKEQLEWCTENEGGIWAYLLQNDLLYNSDYMAIQKYLAEAPFTPGLGENSSSAPKLGIWVGWQIIKEYMDRNPDVTIPELMAETDAQKILKASKYKPKQ